jgi:hypothetical protein
MANALYDAGREGFLAGEIDWDTATIKVSLVRGYTYSSSHKFVSDVTGAGGGTLVATVTLTSKTITGGVADASDATFASVASGASITSVIIYQASAVTGGADVAASAQRLIAYVDTMTNLPVTPNGGDIIVAWDNSTGKIFKL